MQMFHYVINFTNFNSLSSESVCRKLLCSETFHKDLRKTDNKLLTVCLYVPGLIKKTKLNKINFTFPRKWSWTSCKDQHSITRKAWQASTGTHREYGKAKKRPSQSWR